jgi:hypothetical protein
MGRTLSFEEIALRIQPAGGGGLCTVQITQSPYGARASCEADFSSLLQDERVFRALEVGARGEALPSNSPRNVSNDAADIGAVSPEDVGTRLFRTLFSGPVLDAFHLGLGHVEANPDTGLRIRLQLDPALPDLPAISALPWELLCRADKRDFLARNPLTPVVRYLEVSRLTAPAPLVSSLRILVIRSRPHDLPALSLGSEENAIADAWKCGPGVEIDLLDPPTLPALTRRLLSEKFHVLHFMGHGDFEPGTGEGVLMFEDSTGKSAPISGRVMAEALKGSQWLRLVVLNACETAQLPRRRGQDPFSGVASALIQAGLPAVIAMQLPISDQAALVFSRDFYTALAAGFPVDAAAAEARRGVYLAFERSWEWATPALFMNVPDGRLLHVQEVDTAGTECVPSQVGEASSPNPLALIQLDQLEASKKRGLLDHYETQLRESPDDPHVHFALGLLHLDLRRYDQALTFLQRSAAAGGRDAGLFFCLALASLGGRQPRTLPFAQIKKVESVLHAGQFADGETPEILLLSAIIKHDYYRAHRLRIAPPQIEDLLASAGRSSSTAEHLRVLSKHLTVPAAIRELLLDAPT